MPVFEDHQHRPPPREAVELPEQSLERLFLFSLRLEVERVVPASARQRQKVGQQRRFGSLRLLPRAAQQSFELIELRLRRVVAGEPGGPLKLCNERMECTVLAVRRAEVPQAKVLFGLDRRLERHYEARLAD